MKHSFLITKEDVIAVSSKRRIDAESSKNIVKHKSTFTRLKKSFMSFLKKNEVKDMHRVIMIKNLSVKEINETWKRVISKNNH